jgi:hypothetical protein
MDSTAPAEHDLALIAKLEADGDKAGADRLRTIHTLIAEAKAAGRPTERFERELKIQTGLATGDVGLIEQEEQRSGRSFFARPRLASWSMTAKPALALVGRQAARPRERRDGGCRRSGSWRTSRTTRAGPSDPDEPEPPRRRRHLRLLHNGRGPRCGARGFALFQRPRPLERPEKGEDPMRSSGNSTIAPGDALYRKIVAEGRALAELTAEWRLRGGDPADEPTPLDAIRARQRQEAGAALEGVAG